MVKRISEPWMDFDIVMGDWLHHIIETKLDTDERRIMFQVVDDAVASSGGGEVKFGGSNKASQEVSSWLLFHSDWGQELNDELPDSVAESVFIVLADNPDLAPKAMVELAENVAQEVDLSQEEVLELLESSSGLFM